MNSKNERQKEILRVIAEHGVATQAELRKHLAGRGIRVDQATLSRDIRELGIVKVASGGGYRYAPVEEVSPVVRTRSEGAVARFVRSVETSGNLVIIKTDPGNAPALGLSIDHLRWPEVAGTVAGDDTLLIVAREGTPPKKLGKKVEELGKRARHAPRVPHLV